MEGGFKFENKKSKKETKEIERRINRKWKFLQSTDVVQKIYENEIISGKR